MAYYEVSLDNVVYNYQLTLQQTKVPVWPVLKADAYGLGAVAVRDALAGAGVSTFAVSRLEEADEIAKEGLTVIVLSVYHDIAQLQHMVQRGYVMAVDSLVQAKKISEIAGEQGARVHIAVDTGFGRFGFLPDEIEDMAAVYALPNLHVEGIFSHLSAAFAKNGKSAKQQLKRFTDVTERLAARGIDVGVRHIANSCALVRDCAFHLDAVRAGSILCGRLPMSTALPLKRVGQLVGNIADIRQLPKGHNIGYGDVYRLRRNTRVAVVPLGTADGLQVGKNYDTYRLIDILRYGYGVFKMLFKDNRIYATIGQKRVPVLGRVALTHVMLDVTAVDCSVGDEVCFSVSPLWADGNVPRRYI